MKIFLMKNRIFGWTTAVLAVVLVLTSSCNHDFEVKVQEHERGDTEAVNIPQRKVLYLIVDGLRGRSIPQINPPTILRMTNNAVYTFDGLGANSGKEITSWANMLTGVKPDKHKVTDTDLTGNDLAAYPMFFTRLKEADSSVRTAAFCSSSLLADNLVSDADIHLNLNNDDEAVKNALIDELQNDDKVTVVLGEFNSVKTAGDQAKYDTSSAEYVDAVMTIDGYIADILDALRKRKNYKNEDWLVVVASDQGGTATLPPGQNTNNVFGNPVLNSFIVFYNPRYTSKIISKPNTANIPYEGYAIRLKDKGADAVNAFVPADKADIYNFGNSGEFTVQLKVYVFDFGTTWPGFFGKRVSSWNHGQSPSGPGWIFMFHSATEWRVIVDGGNTAQTSAVQTFGDSSWHTLTLKVYEENGKRYFATYTDGNKGTPMDISGLTDISNNEPLTAGYVEGWVSRALNMYITDVKIYDTALSDDYINEHGGDVGLDSTSPYYGNIIGYWPCTDGIGNKFKDLGPYHNDMEFNITSNNKDAYSWTEQFSNLSGLIFPPLPSDLGSTVPRGTDIPYMIYHWMGINASSWNLDGQFWLPGYNDVK